MTAQQTKVSTAMTGMASQTGRRGEAGSPPMTRPAIGARNNRCIKYIPKEPLDRAVTSPGAVLRRMQENTRNRP